MTRAERVAQANELEAQAEVNDAYRAAMEATTVRTGGRLGHLNAPNTYAAHGLAAAQKRLMAATIRAEALNGG